MKRTKLIAMAVCALACIVNRAFADGNTLNLMSGGMIFNAYRTNWMGKDELKESHAKLPPLPALKTGIDNGEKFGKEITRGVEASIIKWEGFLECKLTGKYTFTFQKREGMGDRSGYSIKINGASVIDAGFGESVCDVDLIEGYNKVEIVCQFDYESQLKITYRPKGFVVQPRELTPAKMYYEYKPEPVVW